MRRIALIFMLIGNTAVAENWQRLDAADILATLSGQTHGKSFSRLAAPSTMRVVTAGGTGRCVRINIVANGPHRVAGPATTFMRTKTVSVSSAIAAMQPMGFCAPEEWLLDTLLNRDTICFVAVQGR